MPSARPKFFWQAKIKFWLAEKIWLAKNIKILYNNEGPKTFGWPNIFWLAKPFFGRADSIGTRLYLQLVYIVGFFILVRAWFFI